MPTKNVSNVGNDEYIIYICLIFWLTYVLYKHKWFMKSFQNCFFYDGCTDKTCLLVIYNKIEKILK